MKYIIQAIGLALVGTGAWFIVSILLKRNFTGYDFITSFGACLILAFIQLRSSKK